MRSFVYTPNKQTNRQTRTFYRRLPIEWAWVKSLLIWCSRDWRTVYIQCVDRSVEAGNLTDALLNGDLCWRRRRRVGRETGQRLMTNGGRRAVTIRSSRLRRLIGPYRDRWALRTVRRRLSKSADNCAGRQAGRRSIAAERAPSNRWPS